MADLLWAREAGAQRRATLERDAKKDAAAAQHLVSAMFDGLISQAWRRLGTGIKETVEAYNAGGRFSDISYSASNELIVIERRHHPAFTIDIRLERSSRQLNMHIKDGDQDPQLELLETVFVDDELLLWHAGQTENGYQLARRVLKPRL